MRYVSLFSGIEAASVAWETLGWKPVAFSEVEPFACSVLDRRFPSVPNLGDVCKIDWSDYVGSVDVLVGGSPCQAFSVAGRRGGLDDPRGQLMLEYVRAVRDLHPEWLVWENVPGVLSQDGGRSFGTLLRELEDCGYSLAWRVLDAQFMRVAQRRRRVFLVGHIRAGCAAAVLFERASMSWDSESSREKRQELARSAGLGACGGGCTGPSWSIAGNVCDCDAKQNGSGVSEDCGGASSGNMSPAVCMASSSAKAEISIDCATCLTARQDHDAPIVFKSFAQNVRDEVRFINGDGTIAGALAAQTGAKQQTYVLGRISDAVHGAVWSWPYIVRRLTPIECERLQGFPGNWTDLGGTADAPRYRALGNSMAVPVMQWIGKRIGMVEEVVSCER